MEYQVNRSSLIEISQQLCHSFSLLPFQVEIGFAKQLFRSNMAAISANKNIALHLLPYVIVYLIAEDTHINLVGHLECGPVIPIENRRIVASRQLPVIT